MVAIALSRGPVRSGHIMKTGSVVELGAQLKQPFPHPSAASDPAWAVEWIELPRGISLSSLGSARTLRGWSRSSRPSSVDSQDLPEVRCGVATLLMAGARGDHSPGEGSLESPLPHRQPAPRSPSCAEALSGGAAKDRPRSGLLRSAPRQPASHPAIQPSSQRGGRAGLSPER